MFKMKLFVDKHQSKNRPKPRPDYKPGQRQVYRDGDVEAHENFIALNAEKLWKKPPLKGPLRMSCIFAIKPPSSWSEKKKKEAVLGFDLPDKKPDLSNILKTIEDALEGIVYENDCQICQYGDLEKIYGKDNYFIVTVEKIIR
jgi:Holliday junction resolvase RusA-like endonuclease